MRPHATSAGMDAPAKSMATPSNETANVYKQLQNGSDVRGIAITGKSCNDQIHLTPSADMLSMPLLIWCSDLLPHVN